MKGKILVSILALGASSIVLANGSHIATTPTAVAAEPNYFDGFIVGLDGSMQHLNGNAQDSVGYQTDNWDVESPQLNKIIQRDFYGSFYSDTSRLSTDVGDNTLGGGIFAGYGKVFNTNYYLGGEVYARYAHNTINANTNGDINIIGDEEKGGDILAGNQSTSINIDSDWSYGAALKLGYLVTPKTMIYLLAGVEYSKFKVDVSHRLTGITTSWDSDENVPAWTNSYSFDNQKLAFVPGVGIETMLTDKLSLKAEYTYADFGQFSHGNNSSSPELSPSSSEYQDMFIAKNSSEDKVSLKRGLFSLGLAYHFNGI